MARARRPFSRFDQTALAFLVAALAVTAFWTVHPWFDKANDASLYLLTARSIAAGEGFTYLGEPFVVRPPGWSFLLAPLVGTESPPSFELLNVVGASFGALAALATFGLTRPRLGGGLAALLALAIWSNPSMQRLSTQVLSDVPGLALVLSALWLERVARERPSLVLHVGLGLLLAVAVYVRTLAVLSIPAILLGRVCARRSEATADARHDLRRGLTVALVIPIVALVPWLVRNATADVTTPTEQVFLHSYATAMVHTDAGDPSSETIPFDDFLERTREQVDAVLGTLGERMPLEPPDDASVACAWLLLAGVLVAWVQRRDAMTWMALATAAILATYFAFQPRLVLPLWALALILTTEAVHDLAPERLRPATRAVLAAVLALMAWHDFDAWSWHDEVRADHEAHARIASKLEGEFEPDAALASFFGWHLGVFLENPVYSLSIVASREGPEASLRLLERHDVAALVFHRKKDPGNMYTNALLAMGFPATQSGNYRVIRTQGFEVPGGGGR